MNCPLETLDNAEVLLDYCNRKLNPESTAILERHMAICPACHSFAESQRTVWAALDSWEPAPVSQDFDRRLYQRIERESTWIQQLTRGLANMLRPLFAYRGVPVAATACLAIGAGLLLQQSKMPTGGPAPDLAIVEVQPEQVEQALDAMDMLSDFSHKVRTEGAESKL